MKSGSEVSTRRQMIGLLPESGVFHAFPYIPHALLALAVLCRIGLCSYVVVMIILCFVWKRLGTLSFFG